MSLQSALMLMVFCFSGEDPTKDAAARELEKLQGTWVLIGGEEKGIVLTEEDARKEKERLVVIGDKLALIRGETESRCTIRLDPGKKPAWMDFVMTEEEGELKNQVNHAIYVLEGDRLKICVSRKYSPNSPDQRPVKFTSKREQNKNLPGLVLSVYARAKK